MCIWNRIPPPPDLRIIQVHPLIPLGPSGDFADPLAAKINRAEGITSSDQGHHSLENADDHFSVGINILDHIFANIC